MQGPEKVVCCTLCLCMAVAVLSSVSLVYLTFIVYKPAIKELQSGLLDQPVVCTTEERREVDGEDCRWASCWEWCLSKPSTCTHLMVSVRRLGSSVSWTGCSSMVDTVCPVADRELVEDLPCEDNITCLPLNQRFSTKCGLYNFCPENSSEPVFVCKQNQCVSRRETLNCKEDHECSQLEGQFLCDTGLCRNMTRVVDCQYSTTGPSYDCKEKRNCITLKGLHQCSAGICTVIEWPYTCTRICPDIGSSGAGLVLVSGDRTLTAHCTTALVEGQVVWEAGKRHGQREALAVSCTHLERVHGEVRGRDCVNATLLPHSGQPPGGWDWAGIRVLLERQGELELGRRREVAGIPRTEKLNIFPSTRLFINREMCVNSLQFECTTFLVEHRRDGRNQTSRDTFPCHYNPHDDSFVTIRFDLDATKHFFLMAFAIPALFWITSCSFLASSNKILRISQVSGQMRLRCRKMSGEKQEVREVAGQVEEDLDDLEDAHSLSQNLKRRMAVDWAA